VLDEVRDVTNVKLKVLTPADPLQRGCQLSVVFPGQDRSIVKRLAERGIVVDWREPNVIRLAPVPMYNSFEDIYTLGEVLIELLGTKHSH
jgi:kynureninase